MPNTPFATSRSGKPVAINDQVTVSGFVTAITGTGSTASVTVQCATSGNSVVVQGADVYSAQTL